MLASFVTVSGLASNTSRRGVGQWGGAGGAICEEHWSGEGVYELCGVVSFFVPKLIGFQPNFFVRACD
jgi:hypothetical protein